jgi:hypothetical protein
MPRDFVPCLYREQVLEGRLIGQGAFSCDVIELFEFSRLDTQETDTRMSRDSHQVTMRQACVIAPDGVPELPHFDVQARLRAPLFGQFYTAMADLDLE